MNTKLWSGIVASLALAGWSGEAAAQEVLAFPDARGFAAGVTGGRGGGVVHVTNLDASGEGSLAWAVAQDGARYVVFEVSGVIEGDVEIPHGDLTLAGQTAPGAGITIHGHLFTPYGDDVGNLVIRHLRIRPPGATSDWPPEQHDALQLSTAHHVMLDHVDVSHGIDENVDLWGGAHDITVQWSAITFANPDGGHGDGAHNFCLLNSDGDSDGASGGRISVLYNLFAHCRARTPALGVGPAEVIGNVVYNGREGFVHHNPAYGDFVLAGNTYRDGPGAELAPFWFDPENDPPVPTRYFLGDNRVDDPGVYDGVVEVPFDDPGFAEAYSFAVDTLAPSQFHPIGDAPDWSAEPGYVATTRLASAVAYQQVLGCAGAWPRDVVSSLAIGETEARTGLHRDLPLDDLLAGLTPGEPPADADRDGMADAWELDHGLDPTVDDHGELGAGGYPAMEIYLDELARRLTTCVSAPPPPPPPPPPPGDDVTVDVGCGCASSDPAGALLLALALPLAFGRSRRWRATRPA